MMGSLRLVLSFLLAIGALAACGLPSSPEVIQSTSPQDLHPAVSDNNLHQLVEGNNAFGLDVVQRLRSGATNVVFSPFSLSQALAMTYAGARGRTADQMQTVLHFGLPNAELHPAFNRLDIALTGQQQASTSEGQAFQLRLANAIWTEKTLSLLNEFLDGLGKNYGAGIHTADFANAPEPARARINDWVSDETERRIRDLIPAGAVNKDTRMVLVNAIYFKADWEAQFDPKETRGEPFRLLDKSQVTVPLMHQHLGAVPYAAGSDFQAVELPYQGGNVVLDLIVPEPGAYEAMESSLDWPALSSILAAMQPVGLDLGLPKFSFSSQLDAGDRLAALGMTDAFDAYLADFSGMTGGRDLYITKALHQAFIAVDEKGTEAAAATSIIMGPTSIQIPQQQLVIDRPFLFLIRDTSTGQILFLGRVVDPSG